ncbi:MULTISPECIES: DUF3179 domain-containing protein [Haloferacaceae]|uniref:DUF3179 domain-containing protein n=1 Tax=Halorubrum glutamatedens TaxID=2707018 RepID=A0ABD5QVB0_9EURY|nr:DUF3179 domain-containing protein [Halobellus captivus]
MKRTRRSTVGSLTVLGIAGLGGCLDGGVVGSVRESEKTKNAEASTDGEDTSTDGDDDSIADNAPPTADGSPYLAYGLERLREESLSGGVGVDGIPSIDDPTFAPIGESGLVDDAPVFGVVRGGEAKAYPQHVLVHHEIVNDTIGGDPVAVTYCPLTGTAQGFERGDTTFGVSGQLVNSNLIMYDRETESRWPQMLATGIDGRMRGEPLREFRVVWTTLGEWRTAHPNSGLLTDDTGYARRYENDPYGLYAPLGGYYATDETMFPALSTPDEGHAKSVVIGARTADGAVAFDKETLLAERVLEGSVEPSGDGVVAVADSALSTGYVYRNPRDATVEPDGSGYRVEGGEAGSEDELPADDLPLERVLAFDAMWFAWAGFYPGTGFVGAHTEAGYGR